MEHAVFCTNKAVDPDVNDVNTDRKRKASSNEKCTWTSKYDDLRAHLNVCEYEVIECSNDGCADKVERREMDTHQQVCVHRMTHCDHCNANVKATAMNNHLQQCPSLHVTCECKLKCTRQSIAGHREKDCPLTKIKCEVIGCNVKVMRKDYEKHEKQAAQQHVRLLSHTLQTLANLVESKPIQVIWRITGIAAKLQETAVQLKRYQSPRFDAFLGGDHKLFISANIEGNKLGLFLKKDIDLSVDKSPTDIGGSSITVSKAGLPDKKNLFPYTDILNPPSWSWGWSSFLDDMTPYIDDDSINVTLYLKLNKKDQRPIIL